MTGHCTLTDEKLRIDKSARGTIQRIYEGSKLFFFAATLVILWLIASIVLDTGVFAREIALVVLGIGVLLGGALGVIWLLGAATSDLSRDNVIQVRSIESIDCSKKGIFPKMVVNYQKKGANVEHLIQFPYMWFSYTDDEFEKAKDLFEQEGIEINDE
jgi:hypothetical protein